MTEIRSLETAWSCVSTRLLPPLSHVCLANDDEEEVRESAGRETHAAQFPSEFLTRDVWREGEGLLTTACCLGGGST